MRHTKQRQVILDTLHKHTDHPGADIIYTEVRKILPRISLGTVYRNLELLSEAGIILKLTGKDGQKRFDPVVSFHPHFKCVRCGAIEDLPFDIDSVVCPDTMDSWVDGRKIEGLNLEYTGLCSRCNGNTDV